MIDTDACRDATGAVLLWQYDDGLHPLAYHSSKYAPAERNYGGGEKEFITLFLPFFFSPRRYIRRALNGIVTLMVCPQQFTLTMSRG